MKTNTCVSLTEWMSWWVDDIQAHSSHGRVSWANELMSCCHHLTFAQWSESNERVSWWVDESSHICSDDETKWANELMSWWCLFILTQAEESNEQMIWCLMSWWFQATLSQAEESNEQMTWWVDERKRHRPSMENYKVIQWTNDRRSNELWPRGAFYVPPIGTCMYITYIHMSYIHTYIHDMYMY